VDFHKALAQLDQFVRGVCRASSKCPGTQDDLYQEAMICLIDLTQRYADKPVDEFMLLARTSIRNRLTSMARKRQVYSRTLDRIEPQESVEPQQFQEALAREVFSYVEARLTDRERTVLALTKKGIPPHHIAKITGRGKVGVFKSLRIIREEIATYHGRSEDLDTWISRQLATIRALFY
jgi:RNA polymerase sigma factor (sigma-70 family)